MARPITKVRLSDYDQQSQSFRGEVTLQLHWKQTFYMTKYDTPKEWVRQDWTPWKLIGNIWFEWSEKPYPAIFEETNQRGNLERKATIKKLFDPSERKEKWVVFVRVKRVPSATETAAYEVEFSERPGSNERTTERPQIVQDTAKDKDDLPF